MVRAAICCPAYVCWTMDRGYFVMLRIDGREECFDRHGRQMPEQQYRWEGKFFPRVVAELGMVDSVEFAAQCLDARYRPVGYDQIHLADNEWGNRLMEEVAIEWFAHHPEAEFVHVLEHAGWHLGFRRDGTIWTTANDMAVMRNPYPIPSYGVERLVRRQTGEVSIMRSR